MALSSHELYLVLRARDEASRVLRSYRDNINNLDRDAQKAADAQFRRGQALATSAVAIGSAAALGIAWFNDATTAAQEYAEQVARTQTQLDGVKVSFDELADIGREVAREIPLPFEQIQTGLYDIFSSMDVTAPESERLIRDLAKAAVGGSTDIETAGRATIGILNAWAMGVEDAERVNDVMFQMVRKGVGTYEEFTSAIGRAVPSTVKAGGSIEDLAGMMAFLTRNNLSTAMSATSAARAYDAITRPKTIESLKKMGVNVLDSEGNFRSMNDIIVDMREKLGHLDEGARSVKLQEIFGAGGGGTIQAMRFFNLAIADSDGLLGSLTQSMYDAGGATEEAYAIMSQTPEAKIQQLKNDYEAMRTEVGDQLIPAKMKLIETLSKLLGVWADLSPETQNLIVLIGGLAVTLAGLAAVVLGIAGMWLMFSAAATMAGTSIGAILGPVGLVIAGIAALVAAGYLIVTNWDTIKAKAEQVWGWLSPYIASAIEGIKGAVSWFWNELQPGIARVWEDIQGGAQAVWDKIQAVWAALEPIIMSGIQNIKDAAARFVEAISPALERFSQLGGPVVEALKQIWDWLKAIAEFLYNQLVEAFNAVWEFIQPVVAGLIGLFAGLWEGITQGIAGAAEFIGTAFGGIVDFIGGIIGLIANLITGNWSAAWESFKQIIEGGITAVVNLFQGLWAFIVNLIGGLVQGIIDFFTNLWDELVGHSIIPDMVNAIIEWFQSLWDRLVEIVTNLVNNVIDWFQDMWDRLVNIVTNLVNGVVDWFNDLWDSLVDIVTGIVTWVQDAWEMLKFKVMTTIANLVIEFLRKWNELKANLTEIVTGIVTWVQDRWEDLKTTLSDVVTGMVDFIEDKWEGLKNGLKRVWETIRDNVFNPLKNFIFETLPNAFRDGVDAIGRFFDGLKEKAKTPVRFVVDTVINGAIIDNVNKIAKVFTGKNAISRVSLPRGFAAGGPVPGYDPFGRDDVLARLTRGEYVVNSRATKMFRPLLDIINGYASGGLVAFGRMVQGMGYRVAEHPAFGGVNPVHSKNSLHYSGNAIDVNWAPGTSRAEQQMLSQLIPLASSWGLRSIFMVPGHYGHAHFDTGRAGGNMLGKLVGGVSDALSGIAGAVGQAWSWLKDVVGRPAAWLRDKINGALNGLGGAGDFIDIIRKVPGYLVDKAIQKLKDIVPGEFFDNGGVAYGRGVLFKNTLAPERILSPRDTVAFEDLVSEIRTGNGFSKKIEQNITINTQEIDPVKHAADLGWILMTRVE